MFLDTYTHDLPTQEFQEKLRDHMEGGRIRGFPKLSKLTAKTLTLKPRDTTYTNTVSGTLLRYEEQLGAQDQCLKWFRANVGQEVFILILNGRNRHCLKGVPLYYDGTHYLIKLH